MQTSSSCSWCHKSVPTDREACPTCLHDAHAPRMACTCGRCAPGVVGLSTWHPEGYEYPDDVKPRI
jgi:hypothetical protein